MTAPWPSDFIERLTEFFRQNPRASYGIAADALGISRSALICGCRRRGLDVLAGKDAKPNTQKSRGRKSRPKPPPPVRRSERILPRKPVVVIGTRDDLTALARAALSDGAKVTRLPPGYARGAFQARYPSLVGSML